MVMKSSNTNTPKYATIKWSTQAKSLRTYVDAMFHDDWIVRTATNKKWHTIAVLDVVPLMAATVTICKC
eukprot:15314733-Ditylum_brightwellii.AAC.1